MLALAIRMIIAMIVVIGVMSIAARVMRKKLGTSITSRSKAMSIETIAKQPLTRGSSVAVVRIGTRNLILGVTDTQISTLGEIEDIDPIETVDHIDLADGLESDWTTISGTTPSGVSSQSWKGMLEQLREATARKS